MISRSMHTLKLPQKLIVPKDLATVACCSFVLHTCKVHGTRLGGTCKSPIDSFSLRRILHWSDGKPGPCVEQGRIRHCMARVSVEYLNRVLASQEWLPCPHTSQKVDSASWTSHQIFLLPREVLAL